MTAHAPPVPAPEVTRFDASGAPPEALDRPAGEFLAWL